MALRSGLLASLIALSPFAVSANEPVPAAKQIYALWSGEWAGKLEYRDYQPPHGRVALPTTLSVTLSSDTADLILNFVYDDGPHKTVKSSSRLTFDPDGRRFVWTDDGKPARAEDIFTLAETSPSHDRMVFLGRAMDDDRPAKIRYTFTTESGSWRILKETTSDGPDFAFRHEYVLHK